MILQNKHMERWDIRLSGMPSEQTAGVPAWKRMLDLALVVAVSPGWLILGVGVALIVLCGSRGPVFFRQRRVGFKGREFNLFKFRTMHVDAETRLHREHFRQLICTEVPMTKLDSAKRSPTGSAGGPAARHRAG